MSLALLLLVGAAGAASVGGAGVAVTAAGVSVLSTAHGFYVREGERRAWAHVARRFGLAERCIGPVVGDAEPELELYGEVGGHPLRVRRRSVDRHGQATHATDLVVGGLLEGVVVSPRYLGGISQVSTGDRGFDHAFSVRGEVSWARALLGPRERAALLGLRHAMVSIGGGNLRIRVAGWVRDPRAHEAWVDRALALGTLLRGEALPMRERLRANARIEPLVDARRQVIQALLDLGGPASEEDAQRHVADPDPYVRCQAAWHLGRQDVLAAVACDREVARGIRARALQAAPLARPDVAARQALVEVLHSEDPELLGTAFDVIRERRLEGALPVLRERFEERLVRGDRSLTEGTGEQRIPLRLARAVRALQAKEAEPLLIALLKVQDPDARFEAIAALGEVGTLGAVLALHQVDKQSWTGSPEAIRAIRAIQHRAGPVGAGAVSLAEVGGELGAVSLAGGSGV